MANSLSRQPRLSAWLFAAAWLAGCAHMEAPPGGPADTRRPFVAAVYPAPDSVKVPLDLHIQIAFSEWVNPDAERGKVYLNPPLHHKLKSKLSGNLLEVTSKAHLDTNTTYTLGVLGSVKDLNGLALESPLELVFSTGTKLDSGKVSGRVVPFQSKAVLGSFAALYPRGVDLRSRFQHLTHHGDSVVTPDAQPNPAKEKPAYLTPADSLGRFAFRAVRPGRYGLLGFQDINGNLNPEIGTEAIAIGPSLEVSSSGDVKVLSLIAYDTIPLKLMEAKWVGETVKDKFSEGTVHLKFSRTPQPLLAALRESLFVRKAGRSGALNSGVPVPVLEVCVHPTNGEIELHTAPLEIDSQYVVYCQGLKDPYGNALDTARSQAPFRVTRMTDTTRPEMIFFGPRKVNGEMEKIGMDRLIPARGLAIYYSRLLTDSTLSDLKSRLTVRIDTNSVPVTLARANHHVFSLFMPTLLLNGQRLQFSLKPSLAEKLAGQSQDSSHAKLKVSTDTVKSVSKAPLGPVSIGTFSLAEVARFGALKFQQKSSAFGSRLVLRSLSSPAEFSRPTPPSEEFVWDSLPEGWYAADYFRDANGDGIWNPGSLSPWTVQEPYVLWMDSVEVKSGGISPVFRDRSTTPSGTGIPTTGVPKSGGAERKLSWPPTW